MGIHGKSLKTAKMRDLKSDDECVLVKHGFFPMTAEVYLSSKEGLCDYFRV
jgi:hypothetical protein